MQINWRGIVIGIITRGVVTSSYIDPQTGNDDVLSTPGASTGPVYSGYTYSTMAWGASNVMICATTIQNLLNNSGCRITLLDLGL